jgi:hypothetical protein
MNSTRRNFFWKAGTALSLPLAAAASTTSSVAADASAPAKSIRQLQQALAHQISDATGLAAELFASGESPTELDCVTRLLPADFGEHDAIEIAADGLTARATFHCAVETQVPIAAEGTLIEMARAQGEGFVRATDRRVLEMVCVCKAQTWKIETLALRNLNAHPV